VSSWLTVSQVADDSGFSARTVLRWIERGDLRAVRFPGGRLRIRQSDYAAMQAAGETTGPGRMLATVDDEGGA
jgi:excisionase family DNA binding protein